MHPWGVFGEKERIGRRSGGKKCCNGRERVKSVFEEVEWRAPLKRFWGAQEPGRGEEVSAAREGRRNGLGAAVENESLGCLENAVNAGGMQGVGGRRLWEGVRHGDKDDVGEQFGWGAVSGGKEVHGLAFEKRMVPSNVAK